MRQPPKPAANTPRPSSPPRALSPAAAPPWSWHTGSIRPESPTASWLWKPAKSSKTATTNHSLPSAGTTLARMPNGSTVRASANPKFIRAYLNNHGHQYAEDGNPKRVQSHRHDKRANNPHD